MDVDGVDGGEEYQWSEGNYDGWGNWVEPPQGDVSALGKGKAWGKGGKKGKGKGKGTSMGIVGIAGRTDTRPGFAHFPRRVRAKVKEGSMGIVTIVGSQATRLSFAPIHPTQP